MFLHTVSSTSHTLNVESIRQKYQHDDTVLLVSATENMYDMADHETKYNLCQPFVMEKIVNYVDTILHSSEIYIIDSCFVGVVLPLLKTKQLDANIVRIIVRGSSEQI